MACSTDSACTAGRAGARVGAGSLPAGTSLIAVRARRNPSDVRRGRRIGSPRTAWTPGRIRSPAPAGATGDRARPAHRRPRRPAGDRPPPTTGQSRAVGIRSRRRPGRHRRLRTSEALCEAAGRTGLPAGPWQRRCPAGRFGRRRPRPGPCADAPSSVPRPGARACPHPDPARAPVTLPGRAPSQRAQPFAEGGSDRLPRGGSRTAVRGTRPMPSPGPYPGAGVRRGLPAVRAEPCGGLGS